MPPKGRRPVGTKRDVRISDALWRALGEAAAIEAAERKAANPRAGAVDRCVILREQAEAFVASKGIDVPTAPGRASHAAARTG